MNADLQRQSFTETYDENRELFKFVYNPPGPLNTSDKMFHAPPQAQKVDISCSLVLDDVRKFDARYSMALICNR